jgi:hypothetical protein
MPRRPVASLLAACALALAAGPARPQSGRDGWARFDGASALAAVHAIVASEAPGDASVSPPAVDDGLLQVQGTFGLAGGSRWATLGAEIAPTGADAGADLRGASVLRIRLAAADARLLRVRIKGGDRDVASAGCYPVVLEQVAGAPADYVIPLSAFRSPAWCGAKAVSIERTLQAVERVEVTANDGPAGPVRFSVGRIDFLADDWDEPDGGWRLAWREDFDGERDHAPAAAAWQADGAAARELALDGAGHLRLRPRAGAPAGGGRVSIRSAPDRLVAPGRLELRLRLPPAPTHGRPTSVRVALQPPTPGAAALVLLEGGAGTGLAAGVDVPGPQESTTRLRSPVAAPLDGHFVTLACEREPGRVRWRVDGAVVKEVLREDLPPAAWSALDGAALALEIAVEGGGEDAADARPELLVDRVRFWQREAAPAPAAPAASRGAPRPATAAAAHRRSAGTAPAPAAATSRVVCEHSARYGLTLCH